MTPEIELIKNNFLFDLNTSTKLFIFGFEKLATIITANIQLRKLSRKGEIETRTSFLVNAANAQSKQALATKLEEEKCLSGDIKSKIWHISRWIASDSKVNIHMHIKELLVF